MFYRIISSIFEISLHGWLMILFSCLLILGSMVWALAIQEMLFVQFVFVVLFPIIFIVLIPMVSIFMFFSSQS